MIHETFMTATEIMVRLRRMGNPQDAAVLQRFFKTGPGEYGEGDVFVGVRVPALRGLARELGDADAPVLSDLLASPIHEARLLALIILVLQFATGSVTIRERIHLFYLRHTSRINNWDLVDLSAPHLVGTWLLDKDRALLYRLVRSSSLWERRIAILATFAFIRRNDFADALRIADLLKQDREDLLHKATGWMLREIGKRSLAAEEAFLRSRYKALPRTMLRYAIEHFPEAKRLQYLRGRI